MDKTIQKDDPNYIKFDVSPLKRWAFNQLLERDETGCPVSLEPEGETSPNQGKRSSAL